MTIFLTLKIHEQLRDNFFYKLAYIGTFQKGLYQMASKYHIPKLERGGGMVFLEGEVTPTLT